MGDSTVKGSVRQLEGADVVLQCSWREVRRLW